MSDLQSLEEGTRMSKKNLTTIKEHLEWLGKHLVAPTYTEADIPEPTAADLTTGASAARLEKIKQLTAKLEGQVGTLHAEFETKEIARLTAENEQLVKKIAEAKDRLRKAEIANGKPQIPLPESTPAPATTATATATTTTTASSSSSQPSDGKESKKKQQQKKKEKKGKGEGKKASKQPAANVPVDVAMIDFRVGHIQEVSMHPDADTLYVETIDVGEESPRTILSGLAKFVPMEEMKDRMVVICCNLKARKMRGIASHGMVMCAKKDDVIEPIAPPEGAKPGDLIEFEKYPRTETTAAELKPKKKIFEQVQPELFTNADGICHYKGDPFAIKGKGPCTASLKDAPIS